jgi:hypothetical protein
MECLVSTTGTLRDAARSMTGHELDCTCDRQTRIPRRSTGILGAVERSENDIRSDRGLAPQLRADVEAGLRQLDAGQSLPFDADAVERIAQAGRAKLAALKAGKP